MISIEHHAKEDEIFIIDDAGNHMDLNVLLTESGDVFLTQIRDDETNMADVIHISYEMLAQLMASFELSEGLYETQMVKG